jgi:hypothetical protein
MNQDNPNRPPDSQDDIAPQNPNSLTGAGLTGAGLAGFGNLDDEADILRQRQIALDEQRLRQSQEEIKNSSILTKALLGLTQSIKTSFGIKATDVKKKDGLFSSLSGGLGAFKDDKVRQLKSVTSAAGLSGLVASRFDPTSMMGQMATGVANNYKDRDEKRTKAADFRKAFAENTEMGRELSTRGVDEAVQTFKTSNPDATPEQIEEARVSASKDKGIAKRTDRAITSRASRLQAVSEARTDQKLFLENKLKNAQSTFGAGASLSDEDAALLAKAQKSLSGNKTPKPKRTNQPAAGVLGAGALGAAASEDLSTSGTLQHNLATLIVEEFKKNNPNADPEVTNEVYEGAMEGALAELRDLGQEQLEELRKIVAAGITEEETTEEIASGISELVSDGNEAQALAEEERLERSDAGLEGDQRIQRLEPEKEKKSGLLDMLMNLVPGVGKLTKALGPIGAKIGAVAASLGPMALKVGAAIGPMATMAAKILGPAAAVAASGAAGYAAGGALNKFVLDPLAGKMTGDENDTVGTALFSGVDKMKSILGMETEADKLKAADKAAMENLIETKKKSGTKISAMSAASAKAMGIEVPEDMIGAQGEKISPVTPATVVQPEPTKPEIVKSEDISGLQDAIKTNTEAVEDAKDEAKKEAPTTIVSAPVSNVNNTTSIKNRIAIRNQEPFIMMHMRQHMV